MAANPQTHAVYEGGFSDPVGASQTVFRALMDAMARPGSVQALPDVTVPPAPLSASASALIATLADADTPVWLDAALTKSSAVRDWIVFHTGAPVVSHASDAAFALVAAPQNLSALNGFSLGTQEFPDRSTTVILQVSTLSDGVPLTLEGPHQAAGVDCAGACAAAFRSAVAGQPGRFPARHRPDPCRSGMRGGIAAQHPSCP
jgi:alpha-D-ribose 1-methylphosphonate 5-triphosphate synthase subunit PhnH